MSSTDNAVDAAESDLVRYWFTFDVDDLGPDPGPPGTIVLDGGTLAYRLYGAGIGVTGYDEADCLALLEEVLDGEPVPQVSSRVRDVDIETLRLRAPVGVPSWRGIWYPALNLKGPSLPTSR